MLRGAMVFERIEKSLFGGIEEVSRFQERE